MSHNKILKRSEIPVEHTWATEDLYVSDAAWEEDLLIMAEEGKACAAFAGKLNTAEGLYESITGNVCAPHLSPISNESHCE